jgi:Cof subfamily protein (haloacid dehalogenase superfamily)
MKYLIFLDIDGTILDNGKIHPRTVDGVREAQKRGHMVFINTGRSMSIIPQIVLDKVKPDGIVGGLGAYIRVGDEVFLSETAPENLIKLSMDVAKMSNNTVILEGENASVSFLATTYLGKEHEVKSVDDIFERFPDINIEKMTYVRPLTEEGTKMLEPYFAVFNHPTYSEIGLKGYSKATGMEFLRERFGIDKDHVIAMGDSDNDTLMLEAAGIAVVMGNGHPDVKKIADFISIDCADGGVGYAIEKLILEKE